MADIVRLGIVYDTSQAAASLNRLNQQLGALQTRATSSQVVFAKANQRWASSSEILASMAKDAGRAATATQGLVQPMERVTKAAIGNEHAQAALKRGLVGLALQATATTGPVGQLTQALVLLGGGTGVLLGVAAAVAVVAFAYREWTQDTRDAKQAQEDLIKALDAAGAHAILTAARIKLGTAQANLIEAESPTKFLTRVADAFRSEGQLETRRQGALRALSQAENDVAKATVKAGDASKDQLKTIQAILDAERKRLAIYASQNAQGLFLAQQGILRQTGDRRLRLTDPHTLKPVAAASPEMEAFSKSLTGTLQATRQVTHAEVLFKEGLSTMADAIEEFAITGTASFTDFLDNILRLLYRDFTGNLINRAATALFPGTNTGSSGGDGPIVSGGGAEPSVQSNVNFTVQTMDAQGVAQWVQRNGATVAAEVARQASRSRGMRKALSRG